MAEPPTHWDHERELNAAVNRARHAESLLAEAERRLGASWLVEEERKQRERADRYREALERIAHYKFDVMASPALDLAAVKEIADEALAGVRG